MYRDWREVTKTILSAHKKGARVAKTLENTVPRNKMKRPETRVYVRWVIGEILRDPSLFKEYTKGKGIIATRERFLQWLEAEKRKKEISSDGGRLDAENFGSETEQKAQMKPEFGKTVIVPVAIPGCGELDVIRHAVLSDERWLQVKPLLLSLSPTFSVLDIRRVMMCTLRNPRPSFSRTFKTF